MAKKKKDEDDLRIAPVDGAPFSLDKISKKFPTPSFKVLVDSTHSGFVNDTEHLMNITIDERETQAMYFLSLKLPLPPYLKKYLMYLFNTDEKGVEGMYKYAETNKAFKQAIGFIQLLAPCFKHKMSAYIELPETHFHPQQQARIMSLFEMIKKDYSPPEPPSPPAK